MHRGLLARLLRNQKSRTPSLPRPRALTNCGQQSLRFHGPTKARPHLDLSILVERVVFWARSPTTRKGRGLCLLGKAALRGWSEALACALPTPWILRETLRRRSGRLLQQLLLELHSLGLVHPIKLFLQSRQRAGPGHSL